MSAEEDEEELHLRVVGLDRVDCTGLGQKPVEALRDAIRGDWGDARVRDVVAVEVADQRVWNSCARDTARRGTGTCSFGETRRRRQ